MVKLGPDFSSPRPLLVQRVRILFIAAAANLAILTLAKSLRLTLLFVYGGETSRSEKDAALATRAGSAGSDPVADPSP